MEQHWNEMRQQESQLLLVTSRFLEKKMKKVVEKKAEPKFTNIYVSHMHKTVTIILRRHNQGCQMRWVQLCCNITTKKPGKDSLSKVSVGGKRERERVLRIGRSSVIKFHSIFTCLSPHSLLYCEWTPPYCPHNNILFCQKFYDFISIPFLSSLSPVPCLTTTCTAAEKKITAEESRMRRRCEQPKWKSCWERLFTVWVPWISVTHYII